MTCKPLDRDTSQFLKAPLSIAPGPNVKNQLQTLHSFTEFVIKVRSGSIQKQNMSHHLS